MRADAKPQRRKAAKGQSGSQSPAHPKGPERSRVPSRRAPLSAEQPHSPSIFAPSSPRRAFSRAASSASFSLLLRPNAALFSAARAAPAARAFAFPHLPQVYNSAIHNSRRARENGDQTHASRLRASASMRLIASCRYASAQTKRKFLAAPERAPKRPWARLAPSPHASAALEGLANKRIEGT